MESTHKIITWIICIREKLWGMASKKMFEKEKIFIKNRHDMVKKTPTLSAKPSVLNEDTVEGVICAQHTKWGWPQCFPFMLFYIESGSGWGVGRRRCIQENGWFETLQGRADPVKVKLLKDFIPHPGNGIVHKEGFNIWNAVCVFPIDSEGSTE